MGKRVKRICLKKGFIGVGVDKKAPGERMWMAMRPMREQPEKRPAAISARIF